MTFKICESLSAPETHITVSITCAAALGSQLCLTLCKPMDCSPPGSSVHGDSPGKNTGVGSHFLLKGNFLMQGLNLGLLHCRQILYHLSYQESPRVAWWILNMHQDSISELWRDQIIWTGVKEKKKGKRRIKQGAQEIPDPCSQSGLGCNFLLKSMQY